ncbi:MAG: DUF4838 domain-containing protein, partial [Calditrichales bacterium]
MFRKKIAGIGLLLAFLVLNCSCSKQITLVADGKSDYVIVVSAQATDVEKYAARELKKYIRQASGAELQITDTHDPHIKSIFVGFKGTPEASSTNLNPAEFGSDEFIIRSSGENILIAGGQPRGTLYGVLEFLSTQLGCRWYTREVITVPASENIHLPVLDLRQKPAFEYRETWYKEAYDAHWAVHNRLVPAIVQPPDSMGGGYKIYPFVHTYYQLVSPEKYFDRHPEYFSLVDGKRIAEKAQLCLTNPEVVRIATQTVFQWIASHPDVRLISVDQNDYSGWCECPDCAAIDEAEGSHSGTILQFVNQIADTVTRIYPEMKFQTLAYSYSEIPPKTIKPHPSVTIRLCHFVYCSAHDLQGCERHRQFVERLIAWEKISERLTIWDYFTDYNHYLLPFPNFETLKNVRFYAEHNCVGLFAQGGNVPSNGGGEFSELRAWVFARLMWNPWLDVHELIDEFINNVYGPAAPLIQEYVTLLHAQVKSKDAYFSIYADPAEIKYLSADVLQKAEAIFIQAEQVSANDPALLKRVALAHLPVLYARLHLSSIGGSGYLTPEEKPVALKKFERIVTEHKITQIAEQPERGNVQKFIDRVRSGGTFITDWWVIGPFENPRDIGLKKAYPPEKNVDLEEQYPGREGRIIRWQKFENAHSGYMDFANLFGDLSESGIAYAYREMDFAEEK